MFNDKGTNYRYKINNNGIANRSKQKEEIMEYVSCELCGSDFNSHFRTVRAHYSDDYFKIERCSNCGLLFVNPRLNSIFRNFCYKKETHLLDWFLQKGKNRHYIAKLILGILSDLGSQSGDLLDVGCGIGTLLDIASEKGYHVMGVELNENISTYAARRHNVICSDFYDAVLPESSFDVIVMEQTLEHLGEPLKALLKAKKLLKSGGFLFIGVPQVDWLIVLIYDIIIKIKRSHLLWSPEDHLFYFYPQTMYKYLNRAGYETVDISKFKLKWRVKKLLDLSYGHFLARKK